MDKLRMKTVAVSCGLALVSGCAFLDRNSQPQGVVVPGSEVKHGAAVTDANYQIGRYYQGRRQYQAAIAAYRKSLDVDPGNAEAHNALGIIYATQGKHEQAITELMAALALAPAKGHLHNNLGYIYLLQNRNVDALAAFKVASELDPGNERLRVNMKTAEERLALETPSPSNLEVPAVVGTESASRPTDNDGGNSAVRLVSVAPNVFELRQGSPIQVKPSLPLATKTAPETVRLEVANGNGVSGFAKRTSFSLERMGYVVTRLTNQVPYTQRITEIQYRQGEEDHAVRLNSLLSAPAKLVESRQLNPRVSVRLVLGRDAAQRPVFIAIKNPQSGIAKL